MRFADPNACPECGEVVTGLPACPHCGLDLTTQEVRTLWQTLLHADELLALASVHRVAPRQAPTVPTPPAPAPAPAPTPTHTAPAPPVVPLTQSIPSYPAQAPAPKPAKASTERSWSVGTILLVLGAFGLIVAGLIFVTRSWDNLGLTGRTVILGGVTALIGVLGVWVTRRPLRASAEAVWTVFLALLTLDFFAARHENLLGLEALSIQVTWIVSGAVLLALCVLIAVWARPLVHAALVAPAVIGGLAIAIGGIGAGGVPEDVDFAWRAFIALIVSGLLALSTRPARLAPMTLVARIVFAGFFVAAYVSAFVEVAAHPSLSALVGDGHGVVMALMAVASIVVAWLVPLVRIPLTACGVAAMSLLLVAPLSADGPTGTIWPTVGVLAAGLAAAGSRGRNDWMRGVRVGAALLLAFAAYLVLYLVSNLLATIGQSLDEPWSLAWDARLDAPGMPNIDVWAVSVLLAAFVVSVWFVSRWPELDRFRSLTPLVMASAIGLAAVVGVTGVRLPVLVAAIVLLAVAVTVLGLRIRRLFVTIGPVALVVVVVASLLALASHGVSAATWMPAAAIVAGLACTDRQAWWRPVYGVAVAVLVPLGVLAVVELFDPDTSITALAVLVAALGLVVVAGLLLVGDTVRLPVEVTSALAVAAALFAAGSTGEVAVRWTVAGVVAIALSFCVPDRRWYLWPGLSALVVAYILLIVDSGFSFVEAYTLPLGVAALGVGGYLVRRDQQTPTWLVLGPGLAIALLPSVPQALADPTGLRALLLGVAALAVLVAGVRLHWQAPFVSGVVILTALLLFNIGPYANAAPRVVLIAIGSAILLGIGITWEDRVRDGRKVVRYVRSMR